MRRRDFIGLIAGATITWPLAAAAQQAGRVYKIGVLNPDEGPTPRLWTGLADGLRALGWTEGRNFVLERRFADNQPERLTAMAVELVDLKADLILTIGTLASVAAERAPPTIPIVMIAAGDPLRSGLVESLARPGGNVTGLSMMAPDVGGKRLELLKQMLPRVSRVAVLWNAANSSSALTFNETSAAARALAI